MKTLIVAIVATCCFSLAHADSVTMPFSLPWMNAANSPATYSSADHADGVFVVENYFLGCPYCNDNASNVNDLAGKYLNQPRVQVLDVGVDTDDSDYAEWISDHTPNHPVLNDGNMTLTGQLGTSGYPSTYVIDCKGNVVYSHSGEWDSGDESKIAQAIDAQLALPCSAH